MQFPRLLRGGLIAALLLSAAPALALEVGFAEIDITPNVEGPRPVWIAGYGQNRRAESVHDPLYARAVVFKDGDEKIALVCADLVGLQYPDILAMRDKIDGFKFVSISVTHNHEGPDTMGIWGPSPFRTGVDPQYMEELNTKIVQVVQMADEAAVEAEAAYGTAEDESLLRDSRDPQAKDGVLRVLKFTKPGTDELVGVLVQWNNHPECMGSQNKAITADFPFATIATVKEALNCPVAYFTGAVGGLMAPPRNVVQNEAGEYPGEGSFEYTELYGQAVGRLALEAIEAAEPITLTPFDVSVQPITIPLENKTFLLARMTGILQRDGLVWTGDWEEIGEPLTRETKDAPAAALTEVSIIRLGELYICNIPGEVYPEMVYGTFQDPVDPGADYPDAELEPTVVDIIPTDKWLLIGLANDEIGYIVPKRQWDVVPPFAYGRDTDQYGEGNSLGKEAAPIVMNALKKQFEQLPPATAVPAAPPADPAVEEPAEEEPAADEAAPEEPADAEATDTETPSAPPEGE